MSEALRSQAAHKLSRFKRYPAYKDSRVEWLEGIPTHWETKRLRFLCVINPTKAELSGLPGSTEVSFLPMEAIGEDGDLDIEQTRQIEQVWQGYTNFRNGDVIVAKITPCFENGKGALCAHLLGGRGFGTTELQVLRPSQHVHAPFLFYFTKSHPFRNLGIASMKGVAGQQRITDDFVKDFRTPLPSILEQKAITSFLDRETAKIDALVAKKERLVELLQEKRAALITHAVTKGLNSTVPMKDSGVAWLGRIPAHWEVKRLMRLTPDRRPIMYGIVLPGPNVDDGVPIVKGGDVAPGRLRLDLLNRTTRKIEAGYVRSRLRGGDLVYAIRGSIGTVEVVPAELEGANLTQDAARVTPRTGVDNRWLLFALKAQSVFGQLEAGSMGAAVKGINIRDLKRAILPVPPLREQEALASVLDREAAKLDALIAKVREGIERLKEYRTALISAAVTGKIDVREAV